jgi:hypothetical protein
MTCALALSAMQAGAETFTANATVKPVKGAEVSAPLTATVQKFSTGAEREAVTAAVKKGGTAARDLLAKQPTIGSIDVAGKSTPIKYAFSQPAGSGRLITLMTAEPIHFVVGDHPDTKAQAGHDIGVVLIDMSSTPAHGEAALAAKVKIDAKGAIVIDDYGDDVVRLANVVAK